MTAADYLSHIYVQIAAKSYSEAVRAFYEKRHYVPAPVFGPVGCGDALESKFVRPGFYHCAVREVCAKCSHSGQLGCDPTCDNWPHDLRQE